MRFTLLPLTVILSLATLLRAEDTFESRTWTDRQGNQLKATFVDAKNGEVQFKNDAGQIQKFKLADFAEPDQKYLRDLASYRRKLAAGEKPELPADPAQASLDIQPRQTITEPVADMPGYRKPLLEFPIRIWTDVSGKKVQGKLVTAYNDKVVIDVKGNVFDLAVTRLSPEDQKYVAVQLRGLQRDDLVNVLAKAATTGQTSPDGSTPAAAPMPTEVAGNNPMPAAPLETTDLRARLEQLKTQREGNPEPGTQVAAATPPEQPLTNDDIKARLAQIRQEKGEPEPVSIETPANQIPSSAMTPQEVFSKPTPQSSGSNYNLGKRCMSCNKLVPDHLTAGNNCPHCGVFFEKDTTNGKKAKDPTSIGAITGYISAGLFILVCIGKLISKFSGN